MAAGRKRLRVVSMRWLLTLFVVPIALCFIPAAMAAQDDPRLEGLFESLLQPLEAEEARRVEVMIWQIWGEIDDPKIERLLDYGTRAMALGAYDRALIDFNAVVELAPEMAEAWNKRATLHYLMGNYPESIMDIERTLALEPRHFGALSGLGLINMALGRDEVALKAFEAALEVNPHLPGPKANIEDIKRRLEGEAL